MPHCHFPLLLSLLTTFSILLSSCGSVSSPPPALSSKTAADFTFTNVNSPAVFNEIHVMGALHTPKVRPHDLREGNGVFSHGSYLMSGPGDYASNSVFYKENGDYRTFEFGRAGLEVRDPKVGTVYDMASRGGNRSAKRRLAGSTSTLYETNSGTITVTARNGDFVLLQLSNVIFETPDPNDNDEFTLNGTLSYNLKDMESVE